MAEPEVEEQKRKSSMALNAVFEKNSAGQAVLGELDLRIKPVPLTFGAGGGVIHFSYFQPQPYAMASVALDTNLGLSGHLFGRVVNAVVASTSDTRFQNLQGAAFGTTWDLVPEHDDRIFRLGYELSGRTSFNPDGLAQYHGLAGGGVSIGNEELAGYAIGRLVIGPNFPNEQYWTDVLVPWFYEAKAGAVVSLKGEDMGVEVSAASFEQGAKAFFRFKDVPLSPEISANYRRTSELFGGSNEVGVGLSVNIGAAKASAHAEAGAQPPVLLDAPRISYASALERNLYLYGTGKISFEQFYSRLAPKLQAEVKGGFSQSAAVDYAKKMMGQDLFDFTDAFFSTGSMDALAARYSNATFEQKIIAAARLGSMGLIFYDHALENTSTFSANKQALANINSQDVYATMRNDLMTNQKATDGVCVNINGMVAEFLRKSGIEAYSLATGIHMVAAAYDPGTRSSYVVTYGDIYKAHGGGIWPAFEAYARSQGTNLTDVYVYGAGNKFIGLYHPPEGRLVDSALGMEEDLLRRSLIRKKE